MNEVRIIFDKLVFEAKILDYFRNSQNVHGLTLHKGDYFILSMDWAWRAPDKENFSSILAIDAKSILQETQNDNSAHHNYTPDTEFKNSILAILKNEKLRIRTEAWGKSTIRFSLVYADQIFSSSFFTALFEKLGGLLITKLTGGLGVALKKVLETAGSNALENIIKSDKDETLHPLGGAQLEYDETQVGEKAVKLLDKQGKTVAVLHLKI